MNATVEPMTSFEWLGQQLRAKTAQYETSVRATGERPPNWDDKLGVIAKMDDDLQKDLAYLLAYGDYRDGTAQYKSIEGFLFKSIYAVAEQEKKRKPDLAEICKKIARMELYFFLHNHLNDKFTGAGRLWFSGIDIKLDTYTKNWKHYGDAVNLMLLEAQIAAIKHIENYKKELDRC